MSPFQPPRFAAAAIAAAALLLTACAAPVPYDYTAFKKNRPASLLVLPPLNDSPEVLAGAGVMSTATRPLAEAGYYVFPAALVNDAFRENGLTEAAEIQEVSAAKLREIFGADAAVYLRVKQYGTSYAVLSSETRVTVEGRIVDLRSGEIIWSGRATASSAENQGNNQAGLIGLLVQAVVHQVIGTATDASFKISSITNDRLLGSPRPNGLLAGPRSPRYMQD